MPPRLSVAVEPVAPPSCAAPASSLYFTPDGTVLTCCVNVDHVVGRVGESSLRDIWEGARLVALREALARGDHSLGCERCDAAAVPGGASFSHARQFDRFEGQSPGAYPRRMDFVLSNRCNLQCVMCNGDLSSSIRSQREGRPPLPPAYDDAFFEELREFLPHLDVAFFLGGEPFLAREARRVWDLIIEMELDLPVFVVTNGTQWGPVVEHYLRSLDIGLSVSVDGATPATTAALRVGADRDRVMANVERYRAIVEPKGGNVVLNYCLMVDNWRELRSFLAEADALDLEARMVTVTDPPSFSLYSLDDAALTAVVRELDAEAASGPPLGRNADVWVVQLERLHRELRDRRFRVDRGQLVGGGLLELAREADALDDDLTIVLELDAAPAPGAIPDRLDVELAAAATELERQLRADPPLGRNRALVAAALRTVREELARLEGAERAAAAAAADLRAASGEEPLVLRATGGTICAGPVPAWADERLGAGSWAGRREDEILDLIAERLGPVSLGPDQDWGAVGARDVFTLDGPRPRLRLREVHAPAAEPAVVRLLAWVPDEGDGPDVSFTSGSHGGPYLRPV